MKITVHTIDDLAQPPAQPSPPPRRAGLRNWQVAVVYAMIHTGVMTTIISVGSGSNELGMYSLAYHGAVLLLALAIGAMLRLL
jgi:hypothetical protein